MFKNEGGGVNGCLNNVQKNCGFGNVGHPLVSQVFHVWQNNYMKFNNLSTKQTRTCVYMYAENRVSI